MCEVHREKPLMPRFVSVKNNNYRCVCCLRRPIYDQEANVLVCPTIAGFCCDRGAMGWPAGCPDHEISIYERQHHFYLAAEKAWLYILPYPNMKRVFRGEQN